MAWEAWNIMNSDNLKWQMLCFHQRLCWHDFFFIYFFYLNHCINKLLQDNNLLLLSAHDLCVSCIYREIFGDMLQAESVVSSQTKPFTLQILVWTWQIPCSGVSTEGSRNMMVSLTPLLLFSLYELLMWYFVVLRSSVFFWQTTLIR